MCQWFNVPNCQSAATSALHLGVLCNRWLVGDFASRMALQAAALYPLALNRLFHTVPPLPLQDLPVIGAAASCAV